MHQQDLCERMRADWNRRAREDAEYYVAFGRRKQTEQEFYETGAELARGLARELKRLPPANPRSRRALEIGCGLARLMRPMSRHFGEIHGVDVSDEMINQARQRLADIPHAHVHLTRGADLDAFADDSFDFIYSYAVFQHIPSRDVVFRYLEEARRTLKPGGVFRFQANGLPETAARYDTWSGVRIAGRELAEFAARTGLLFLALEGTSTQYMWATFAKPRAAARPDGPVTLRRVTNAHSSEPVVPARGRFAVASLWLENLPPEADLNTLEASIGGAPAPVSYVGPAQADGLHQVNIGVPETTGSGLHPVRICLCGRPILEHGGIRVIPPGPMVPRLISVTDGIDLLAGTVISSRIVKINLEEIQHPALFSAAVDGNPARGVETFCVDPQASRYEFNLPLPKSVDRGPHLLELAIGARRFAPVPIEVA